MPVSPAFLVFGTLFVGRVHLAESSALVPVRTNVSGTCQGAARAASDQQGARHDKLCLCWTVGAGTISGTRRIAYGIAAPGCRGVLVPQSSQQE